MVPAWSGLGAAIIACTAGVSYADPTAYVQLEMYAAVQSTDDIHRPENLDLYDSAGLIDFLATQIVVETGKDAARRSRQRGIDTIVKYGIRILNPLGVPDVSSQGEYATYATFAYGATVDEGPLQAIARSGDLVGVQRYAIPNGDPRFPYEASHYAFSLSGKCPNKQIGSKDSPDCLTYAPGLIPENASQLVRGGLCPTVPPPEPSNESNSTPGDENVPTGTPGCVYTITQFQTIKLDDLAGIRSEDCGGHPCADWSEFRHSCTNPALRFQPPGQHVTYCKEYDYPDCIDTCATAGGCNPQNEVGLSFWKGRCNAVRNLQRTLALEKAFGGNLVDSYYATNPPCEKYSPLCNKPIREAGIAYCHRDQSGVCDQCFVPGTTMSHPIENQVNCRQDLFLGATPQYKDQLPECSSDCKGTCSNATDTDLCCLYTGSCRTEWKAGDWQECNVACGDGSATREVTCPFADLVGPCDQSTRPANFTACKGNRCPWDPHNFSDWGACSNGCGHGAQTREAACLCPGPDPCGPNQCSKTPKPQGFNRSCFSVRQPTEPDFCGQCPAGGGACSRCLDHFLLSEGGSRCTGNARVVVATYRLTAHDAILDSAEFVTALVAAFVASLEAVGQVYAQVDCLKADSAELLLLRRLGDGAAARLVAIVATDEDSDAGLNRTRALVASVDSKALSARLLQELPRQGCTANCTAPAGLQAALEGPPVPLCPGRAPWDLQQGCTTPPDTTTSPPTSPPTEGGGHLPLIIGGAVLGAVLVVAAAAAGSLYVRSKRRKEQLRQAQAAQARRRLMV